MYSAAFSDTRAKQIGSGRTVHDDKTTAIDSLCKGDLKKTIADIYADTDLSEKLEPLTKLLLTKNDRLAKQVVKSIQRCLL